MISLLKKASALLLGAAVLAASGCGLFEQMKKDAELEPTEAPAAAAPDNAPDGITLRLGAAARDTFNPLISRSDTLRQCMTLVYEPLYEADAALRPVGILAESASRSADGKTLAVKLRSGITWHDGSGFGARDAVYTINAVAEGKTAYSVPGLTGASVTDSLNIKLYFSEPAANPTALLTFPIIKEGTPLEADSAYVPVGTGQYKFDAKISVNEYRFVRYDGAAAVRDTFDGLVIVDADSPDELKNMFYAGEIDCFYSGSDELASFNAGNGSSKAYITDSLVYIGLNLNNAVLADRRIRQAINCIINKQDIVNTLFYKKAVPSDTPVNPWAWVYEGYENNSLMYSPDMAEKLMADAGWADDGSGRFVKETDGRRRYAQLSLLAESENDISLGAAKRISDALNGFGISLSVEEVSRDTLERRINNMDYDMYIGECETGKNMDFSAALKAVPEYENEELSARLERLAAEDDLGEIYRLYGECSDIFKEDMPMIPLYFKDKCLFFGARLKGYTRLY